MKSGVSRAMLAALIVLVIINVGCLPIPKTVVGNQPPTISSLEAVYPVVYPRGYTKLKCVASDPEGDAVKYTWSHTGGSLSGEGPDVIWTAPAEYGDYHIMVVVQDAKGASTKSVLTVSVVVRPPEACCGGKKR